MDTEAHPVLWKLSHPWTMQSSWTSNPGSHKLGCFGGGLTFDPSRLVQGHQACPYCQSGLYLLLTSKHLPDKNEAKSELLSPVAFPPAFHIMKVCILWFRKILSVFLLKSHDFFFIQFRFLITKSCVLINKRYMVTPVTIQTTVQLKEFNLIIKEIKKPLPQNTGIFSSHFNII